MTLAASQVRVVAPRPRPATQWPEVKTRSLGPDISHQDARPVQACNDRSFCLLPLQRFLCARIGLQVH